MSNQKQFGRWRIKGSIPFIETTLENGELYYHDAQTLQAPEYRREVFERLGQKEGITGQDIADFQAALQSLGPDSPSIEDSLAAKLGLTEDDLRKEREE